MKSFLSSGAIRKKFWIEQSRQFPKAKRSEFMEKMVINTRDVVLTYHLHNVAIMNILSGNFKSRVLRDEYMWSVFNDSLPITANRKGNSLKVPLVTIVFKSATRQPLV